MSTQDLLGQLSKFENEYPFFKSQFPVRGPMLHRMGIELITSESALGSKVIFGYGTLIIDRIPENKVDSVIASIKRSEPAYKDIEVSVRPGNTRVTVTINDWPHLDGSPVLWAEHNFAHLYQKALDSAELSKAQSDEDIQALKAVSPIYFWLFSEYGENVVVRINDAMSLIITERYPIQDKIDLGEVSGDIKSKFPKVSVDTKRMDYSDDSIHHLAVSIG